MIKSYERLKKQNNEKIMQSYKCHSREEINVLVLRHL